MKNLPIGIQTFEKLINKECAYVDKTYFLSSIGKGGYYFLSRPRRFGKSLFLSTIKAAFEGKRELFRGLYLHDNWDWSESNPVVHISFGSGVMRSVEELRQTQEEILTRNCRHHHIGSLDSPTSKGKFFELIELIYEKHKKPLIILIDEYDKPILDNIDKPKLAVDIREELKNYYSVI
ncbi:MAG: AAA family ATPase, partial [Desulfovermiculus sp.]|nr:AAA family ATPase [Desulfovermiculus sp.]